jgi:hypothetical protein
MRDNYEINVPGKFSPTEEAILEYLYAHPGDSVATADLVKVLKPEQNTIEAFDEIQYGIETLVAARVVNGKRVSEAGTIQYTALRLTTKGQAEAIKQQRRTKSIKVSVTSSGE